MAVHSLGNAFALGGIIRVAHNFLAREVIVIGNEPHYEKASMGMEKYETLVRVADDEAFFEHVRGRPVWAFERESAETSVTEVVAFPKGVVFVVGSERAGLSPAFLARADAVLGIPIYGVNQSLPVVVAAGIAMHEWARRHYANGRTV